MQVRQLFAAALLAATAVGAMSQEIDRRDQARPSATSTTTRQSVNAEMRNLQAQGELNVVGEKAEAPAVSTVPSREQGLSRADVKADLASYRATHKLRVGEMG